MEQQTNQAKLRGPCKDCGVMESHEEPRVPFHTKDLCAACDQIRYNERKRARKLAQHLEAGLELPVIMRDEVDSFLALYRFIDSMRNKAGESRATNLIKEYAPTLKPVQWILELIVDSLNGYDDDISECNGDDGTQDFNINTAGTVKSVNAEELTIEPVNGGTKKPPVQRVQLITVPQAPKPTNGTPFQVVYETHTKEYVLTEVKETSGATTQKSKFPYKRRTLVDWERRANQKCLNGFHFAVSEDGKTVYSDDPSVVVEGADSNSKLYTKQQRRIWKKLKDIKWERRRARQEKKNQLVRELILQGRKEQNEEPAEDWETNKEPDELDKQDFEPPEKDED